MNRRCNYKQLFATATFVHHEATLPCVRTRPSINFLCNNDLHGQQLEPDLCADVISESEASFLYFSRFKCLLQISMRPVKGLNESVKSFAHTLFILKLQYLIGSPDDDDDDSYTMYLCIHYTIIQQSSLTPCPHLSCSENNNNWNSNINYSRQQIGNIQNWPKTCNVRCKRRNKLE